MRLHFLLVSAHLCVLNASLTSTVLYYATDVVHSMFFQPRLSRCIRRELRAGDVASACEIVNKELVSPGNNITYIIHPYLFDEMMYAMKSPFSQKRSIMAHSIAKILANGSLKCSLALALSKFLLGNPETGLAELFVSLPCNIWKYIAAIDLHRILTGPILSVIKDSDGSHCFARIMTSHIGLILNLLNRSSTKAEMLGLASYFERSTKINFYARCLIYKMFIVYSPWVTDVFYPFAMEAAKSDCLDADSKLALLQLLRIMSACSTKFEIECDNYFRVVNTTIMNSKSADVSLLWEEVVEYVQFHRRVDFALLGKVITALKNAKDLQVSEQSVAVLLGALLEIYKHVPKITMLKRFNAYALFKLLFNHLPKRDQLCFIIDTAETFVHNPDSAYLLPILDLSFMVMYEEYDIGVVDHLAQNFITDTLIEGGVMLPCDQYSDLVYDMAMWSSWKTFEFIIRKLLYCKGGLSPLETADLLSSILAQRQPSQSFITRHPAIMQYLK